jgi:hypothetical protein
MSTGASETAVPDPDCRLCRHYQVTWDLRFPHGCRRLGFRSWWLPAREVRLADGRPCQGFEPVDGVSRWKQQSARKAGGRGTLCDREC